MAAAAASAVVGPPPTTRDAVDRSDADGAQILLMNFSVPDFPPETQGLKALTLTSDIKIDEYQGLLSQSYHIPLLPSSIETLTLELFSLGYPPGFLSDLAKKLPNLKTVVLFSQLFAGISEESKTDAVSFFKNTPNLRAVHFLDVFAKPGFFKEAAKWLKSSSVTDQGEARKGIMFLEVNYTFRHEDSTFMDKICPIELPLLISPGLISCSMNISMQETAEDDPDDPSNIQKPDGKDGVMAFHKSIAAEPMAALTNAQKSPDGLLALNTTLYTLSLSDLKCLLAFQTNIMVLHVCVEMEPGEETKKELLAALALCKNLEKVEIMCNPSLQFFLSAQNPKHETLKKTLPSEADLDELSMTCERLKSFEANVLRTKVLGTVKWEKEDGKWSGGIVECKGMTEVES